MQAEVIDFQKEVKSIEDDKTQNWIAFCERFNFPLHMQNVTVESIKQLHSVEILGGIYAFVSQLEDSLGSYRHNLFLSGKTGTGKTYASIAIAKALLNLSKIQQSIVFVRGDELKEIFTIKKKSLNPDLLCKFHQKYKSCLESKVLIIDDIGTEDYAEWEKGDFDAFIDFRIERLRLPTIFTSNLTYEEFELKYGTRVTSRLQANIINFPKEIDFRGINERQVKRD